MCMYMYIYGIYHLWLDRFAYEVIYGPPSASWRCATGLGAPAGLTGMSCQ